MGKMGWRTAAIFVSVAAFLFLPLKQAYSADCYINSVGDAICDSPTTDMPSSTNNTWEAPPDSSVPPSMAQALQQYYSGNPNKPPPFTPPPKPPTKPPKPPTKPPTEWDITVAQNKAICATGDTDACDWLCDNGFTEYCDPLPTTTVCTPTGNSIVKLDNGFDSCNLSGFKCAGNCPVIGNNGGNCYGDFILTPDMPINYRTEVTAGDEGLFDFGKEYVLSFDYFFKDWDTDSNADISPFQMHSRTSASDSLTCDIGNASTNPMSMVTKDGEQIFYTYKNKVLWKGTLQKQEWMHLEVRLRISAGSDGYVEVWKDGVKLGRVDGANQPLLDGCNLPMRSPYLKLGVYKWLWKTETTDSNRREVLIDNVRIVEGECK